MKNIWIYLLVVLTFSCQEPYHGSRIVANIYYGTGFDEQTLIAPTRTPGFNNTFTYGTPGDPGYVDHYELYAGIDGLGTVRLKNFLIRPALENHHPCMQFIEDTVRVDDGDGQVHYLNMCSYPFPDLNRDLLAIVSAPPTGIGTANPGYNFLDWGQDLQSAENTVEIPSCRTVDGTPVEEKIIYDQEAVTAYCSQLHKDYYVGNPYQLTSPLNGEFYGLVDTLDPRTGLATGGFSFTIQYKIENISSLFVVADPDPERLSEDNINENIPPNPEGKIILISELGGNFGYLDKNMFEGTWHGIMESPIGDGLWFEYTIFYDMDKDSVYF